MATNHFDRKSLAVDGMRRRSLLGMTVFGALAASRPAAAQEKPADYPSKMVRFIVPYPPGAASDNISRALAQELGKIMGQPVIVENRSGGGTIVGTMAAKGLPADGYTLLLHSEGLYSAKINTPGVDYEFSDFELLAPVAQFSYILVVPADRGWNRIEDVKGLSREFDFCTLDTGAGTYSMLASKVAAALGIRYRTIPFKGSAEGLTALLGGQIDGTFTTFGTVKGFKDSSRIRLLASTARPGGADYLPGLKTFSDHGMPDVVFYSRFFLYVRAGTPAPVKEYLASAVKQANASQAMKSARENFFLEEYPGTLDDFRREMNGLVKDFEAAAAKLRR